LLAGLAGPREVRAWFTFPGVPVDNYRLDPTRGGGALLDVGCYAVAAALASLGVGEVTVLHAQQHRGPSGVDLTTSAVLACGPSRAEVTASIERDESQGWRVQTPDLVVDLTEPAFTSWRAPAALRVVEDGVARSEQFAACDAYRLMVEAVSARIAGDSAWVLPLTTSTAVAGAVDLIDTAAGGR